MHTVAKPAGAGVVFIPAAITTWAAANWPSIDRVDLALIAAAFLLTAVSWVDDRRGGLAPLLRLASHASAVTVVLLQLDDGARIAPSVPLLLERAALALAWLWFVNLFNFMDGIDGLAGSETVAIALGYALVAMAVAAGGSLPNLSLILAATAASFLLWNWHPSKVMMGDAGAIPLGFLLGWLMIDLATHGLWAAALILPLYFAADATFTILSRLLHGEKPWHPHREHYYQRAVLAGLTPAQAVARVSIANVCLVLLALLSVVHPIPALAGAACVVAVLLLHLGQTARRNPEKSVQK
jgi:UDP-N-acetylmuramyl pentapeptide phosphotransferase/UDP-N-acetylglucosamine-1-phosphate transferase